MLLVNELLNGAVSHPTYPEARIPQMAFQLILKSQGGLWNAPTVLFVRVNPDAVRIALRGASRVSRWQDLRTGKTVTEEYVPLVTVRIDLVELRRRLHEE